MTNQSGSGAQGLPVGGVLSGTLPNPSFATNGTTPILGTVSAKLGAALNNSVSGSFVSFLSVPVTAGTWLVLAQYVFSNPSAGTAYCVGQLHDGTVELSSSLVQVAASLNGAASLNALYVATGAVTLSLRGNFSSATNQITANAGLTGSLADETQLIAVRIA